MRRKLIKQGNGSYTITLPIKWVRKIKKSEIEIIEDKGSLILIGEELFEEKKVILKEKFMLANTLRSILAGYYRQGINDITLTNNQFDLETISQIVDSFTGYIITDFDKKLKKALAYSSKD